jgi:hypothetical protein
MKGQAIIAEVETQIGLSPGFLNGLWHESDWALVIKLHALIEAVVVHAIVERLGEPKLVDNFARLSLGGRNGKRSFARSLGVLTQFQDKFIEELSRLRNRMAHDPRDASLTLDQYVASLSDPDRTQFAQALLNVIAGEKVTKGIDLGGELLTPEEITTHSPRVPLWLAAMMFIIGIYFERKNRERLREAILGFSTVVEPLWTGDKGATDPAQDDPTDPQISSDKA